MTEMASKTPIIRQMTTESYSIAADVQQYYDKSNSVSDDTQSNPVLPYKTMKGPNHSFQIIDELEFSVKPKQWNNVPLPVVDAVD